jgi:hypothetical protein
MRQRVILALSGPSISVQVLLPSISTNDQSVLPLKPVPQRAPSAEWSVHAGMRAIGFSASGPAFTGTHRSIVLFRPFSAAPLPRRRRLP